MPAVIPNLILFGTAVVAGAVNSVAGGGTLLTFPALLASGMSPVSANATSTVSLVSGSLSGYFGFRKAKPTGWREVWPVVIPSLIGGCLGALWVTHVGDETFRKLIPWLILSATFLFALQEPLRRWTKQKENAKPAVLGPWLALLWLPPAIYGGFFGAGMGVMMLAVLALFGFRDMNEMNALKNLSAVCINGVASVTFALEGKVHWAPALLMAAGATLGGYGGAGIARRVGPTWVRAFVMLCGLGMGLYFLLSRR